MKTPVLQVALDVLDVERALVLASEAVDGGVDWIEVGTPLIKSEGMNAVRVLRRAFPNHTIVADMKTMDTGAFETEMAAKAGADVICILGVADDATIKESVKSARKYGVKIMIDLIKSRDLGKRAVHVEKLGVDYVSLHAGIDQQMRGKGPLDDLKKVAEAVSIPVAAAGGITSETAPAMIEAGAQIVIAGASITKAQDAAKATRVIKRAIAKRRPISSEFGKHYAEDDLPKVFANVSSPNISDAMHRQGAMTGIVPLRKGYHMVGRALTVSTTDGDWAKPVEAIDKAGEGDVIVINVNGGTTAVWGELATWSAVIQKAAGVVIDGALRDADDIAAMEFPAFSRHVVPHAGEPKGFGEIGTEIVCGGQHVRMGDWIIGDDSGVVVVPQENAVEIANRALNVKEQESRIREEIKRGSTLAKVQKLKKWEKVLG